MTVARGVSFGGKVARALRYAPVKAPALLRVIGLQERQRWIPAFAGMTVARGVSFGGMRPFTRRSKPRRTHDRVAGGQRWIPAFAGMTVCGNDGYARGFHWRGGLCVPFDTRRQSPGATQGDRVAGASTLDSRLRGNDGCARGFHWREGCAHPSIRAGQSPGATQGDRVARASTLDSRLRGNDGCARGFHWREGCAALRYAPSKPRRYSE